MDGQHFDDLTRSLACGVSRRRVIGGLATGVVGWALGRQAVAAACPPDQIRRHGQGCVCRSTGRPPQPDGSCPCPTGQTRCGATCVDTSRNDAHCGGCSAPCDDGNPCNVDRCRAGTCIHTPVRCPDSADPCLVALCDPVAGGCTTAPAPDGTRCSDDDACDGTETCRGGVCTPGTAVVCQPSDDCHDTGVCDPRTGLCSTPAKTDGAGCGANGVCCGAVCCEAPDNATPTCAGACGFVCDSGSARIGDVCCPDANVCGTTCLPAPCDAAACLVCRPQNGMCASTCTPPANATATCDAGACGFACDGGFKPCHDACIPADQCCEACGPCQSCQDGNCVNLPNSTRCEDGDLCTLGDVCVGGVCQSGQRLDCPALDLCYAVGACDPHTGVCSTPLLPEGTPCPSGDSCTAGACDVAGNCVLAPRPDGVACDGGVCFNGTCCAPVTCAAGQCGTISDGCGGTTACGGCGSLQVCCGGQCRNGLCCDDASCGAGRHCCAIGCLECCDDSHCPAGTHYCDFGACAALCTPESCPSGQRCCPPGSVTQPGTCAVCCDDSDCDPGWSCCGAICRAQCE